MKADQILALWRHRPFRPFVIHTASGERYAVPHPEHVMISPSGRTVSVSLPDEVVAILDTDSITEVVASPSAGRRRGKAPPGG